MRGLVAVLLSGAVGGAFVPSSLPVLSSRRPASAGRLVACSPEWSDLARALHPSICTAKLPKYHAPMDPDRGTL